MTHKELWPSLLGILQSFVTSFVSQPRLIPSSRLCFPQFYSVILRTTFPTPKGQELKHDQCYHMQLEHAAASASHRGKIKLGFSNQPRVIYINTPLDFYFFSLVYLLPGVQGQQRCILNSQPCLVLMEETPPEMATNREFSSAFQPSLICHQFSSTLLYMMLIRLLPLVLGKEAEFVKSLRRTDQLTRRYAEVREATQQE